MHRVRLIALVLVQWMANLNSAYTRLTTALDRLEKAVDTQRAPNQKPVGDTDLARIERTLDFLIEDMEALLSDNKKESR